MFFVFFFSSRRRHTRCLSDWSSDVCSSDLPGLQGEQPCPSGRAPCNPGSRVSHLSQDDNVLPLSSRYLGSLVDPSLRFPTSNAHGHRVYPRNCSGRKDYQVLEELNIVTFRIIRSKVRSPRFIPC